MRKYEYLSKEITEMIEQDRKIGKKPQFGSDEKSVIRRYAIEKDEANVWRGAFMRDIDKILYCPFYSRYADKTQVFSFYKNDDITRRGLHVQLVSRIARTIGEVLGLNLDLIEAISLGHDIGHSPFGHTGEKYLDELYYMRAGRHFSHNIHSIRVLSGMFNYNLSLQTFSGIAGHDGEMELPEYHPTALTSFEDFDARIESCYLDKKNMNILMPSTLEGCVVRISDIISYLGKDRRDAALAQKVSYDAFDNGAIGISTPEIVNNLMVNIIENSYGKPYIKLDDIHFEALKKVKADNYAHIYESKDDNAQLAAMVRPMMADIYEKMLDDLRRNNTDSPVYTHHISYIDKNATDRMTPYEQTPPDQIIVDYIASMTDGYFIDLYSHLFPDGKYKIIYNGYFD